MKRKYLEENISSNKLSNIKRGDNINIKNI